MELQFLLRHTLGHLSLEVEINFQEAIGINFQEAILTTKTNAFLFLAEASQLQPFCLLHKAWTFQLHRMSIPGHSSCGGQRFNLDENMPSRNVAYAFSFCYQLQEASMVDIG